MAARLDARRTLDDVRGGHDDLRPCDPARALDAEPAGGGGDANDTRVRPSHGGRRERPRVGRRRRRRRSRDRREGVDPSERAQDRSRGHDRVQPLENQRAADLVAHLRLAGQLQQDRAGDPHDREPQRRTCDEASDRVEQSQRRDHRRGSRARTSRRSKQRSAAAPRRRARRRARRGVCRASWRRCGGSAARAARRSSRPTTSPPNESAVAINPRLRPARAERPAIASAIQSARAIGPR